MKLPDDFDFNQSKLQDYVDCPYRFFLRYIQRTKWPALVVDDAIAFEKRGQTGARFHRLIQQYLLGLPEARLDALAQADPEPAVARWWDDFLLNVPSWLEGRRHVETTRSAFLAGRRLIAKYDLILEKPGGVLEIVDWKTSRKPPKREWLLARIQTQLYRFILARVAPALTGHAEFSPKDIRMVYWFAPHPENPVVLSYGAEEYAADQKTFTRLIEEIEGKPAEAFFRTRDLKRCRFCVYRSHCDRGVTAGDLEQFEVVDFEAETAALDLDFEDLSEITF